MKPTSYIELSKSALKNNLLFIREVIGEDPELVSVVKGNAYGHGIDVFTKAAYDCGVRSFAVFSAHEAFHVAEANINFNRLIIMGSVDERDELEWAIVNNVDFFVFDFERLMHALQIAKKHKAIIRIHIELETGMNRTGFKRAELKKLFPILDTWSDYISVQGICSHLAGSENISNYLRIKKQISRFSHVTKIFRSKNVAYGHPHLACSAAIMNYPKTILDMVRVGILQYGFWPSKEVKVAYLARTKATEDPLKRVISWKSKVMDVKTAKAGEFIGYGSSYLAEADMKIAVVPVGYAHGFSRSLSNQGRVLIAGVRVSVIGVVNMNMVLVDVSNLKDVKKGDEVVLIGNQGDHSISVASFSDLSVQLNYELLTRLPHDIPRIIID